MKPPSLVEPYDPEASVADVTARFRLLLGRDLYQHEWVGQQSNVRRTLHLVVANVLSLGVCPAWIAGAMRCANKAWRSVLPTFSIGPR